jgi:hypothetical protein
MTALPKQADDGHAGQTGLKSQPSTLCACVCVCVSHGGGGGVIYVCHTSCEGLVVVLEYSYVVRYSYWAGKAEQDTREPDAP